MKFDELSNRVLGCAIEVHRRLGPGLLESAYQHCLVHELHLQNIPTAAELPIPLDYKGLLIPCAYYADIVVANKLLIEIKSVPAFIPQYEAQILTYLKLLNLEIGFLLNFSFPTLRQGLKRFIFSSRTFA